MKEIDCGGEKRSRAWTKLDRLRGCFFGLAVGDALGAPVEFAARGSYPWVSDYADGGPFNLKAGEWTDDTAMAVAMAHALGSGGLSSMAAMREWRAWMNKGKHSVNGRCFDIGCTTRLALSTGVAPADPSSSGNGSIMRLAPAVVYSSSCAYEQIESTCLFTGSWTHASPACLEACAYLGGVMGRLVNGLPWEKAIVPSLRYRSVIGNVARGDWKNLLYEDLSGSGYVLRTLESAMWCVNAASSFEEAVCYAVNLGDDTDSVGAVAGQLAGARWGYQGIPVRWMDGLRGMEILDAAFRAVYEARL